MNAPPEQPRNPDGHRCLRTALAAVVAALLLAACADDTADQDSAGGGGDLRTSADLVWTVEQDGAQVGTVEVAALEGVDGGVDASFTPASGSLDDAAEILGADHFNWYQFVTSDPDPLDDASGEVLEAPYIDPPCGGYGGVEEEWADNLPWYWDEAAPPDGAAGGDPGNELDDNVDGEELIFSDAPVNYPGTMIGFTTYLVAVDETGDVLSFHGGWTWDATFEDDETTSVSDLERTATDEPPEGDFEGLLAESLCPV